MTDAEFKAACANIAAALPEARRLAPCLAEEYLKLSTRNEIVFLGTRGCGKSSVASFASFGQDLPIQERGGFLDYKDQDLRDFGRLLRAMVRLQADQKVTLPEYKPKVFMRPEIWEMVKFRVRWLPGFQVAAFDFPQHILYEALERSGATRDSLALFGPVWMQQCYDATDRLLPGFAFDAMAETVARAELGKEEAVWKGYATAAANFVQSYQDIAPTLTAIAPADTRIYRRGAQLSVSLDKKLLALRKARAFFGVVPPHKLTAPKFVHYCEQAGIWRSNHHKTLTWATPYAVGASILKMRLTTDGLRRMLSI